MVSTVRKSQASMLAACDRKKARHDECVRCGAGLRSALSSTLRTDVAETATPRPVSSPTIRLYSPVRVLPCEPKDQLAQRLLKLRSSGRPVRDVHLRAMSWRCQRSSV